MWITLASKHDLTAGSGERGQTTLARTVLVVLKLQAPAAQLPSSG